MRGQVGRAGDLGDRKANTFHGVRLVLKIMGLGVSWVLGCGSDTEHHKLVSRMSFARQSLVHSKYSINVSHHCHCTFGVNWQCEVEYSLGNLW